MPTITAAVILSGCGRADGSEIHEATSILIHLARLGIPYLCFAPDKAQTDVIDHLTNQPAAETRNCLTEAARIARGNIKPLSELVKSNGAAFDCLFFPGGFGAAKNLITFASEGVGAKVDPDVQQVFGAFHSAGKPIGLCCIAPVIAARLLGTAGKPDTGDNRSPEESAPRHSGVTVTIGDDEATAAAITTWGSRNQVVPVEQAVTDAHHRISTSPAYMYGDANPWQVYQGIGEMVESTINLCKR